MPQARWRARCPERLSVATGDAILEWVMRGLWRLVAFALLVPVCTWAEPVAPLTLDQALDLLHHQNPELLAAALNIRAAHGDLVSARLLPNPTLSNQVGNFPLGQTNPPGLGVGQTVIEQVGLQEEIQLWGRRGARVSAAGAREAQATDERADLERRLVFETRSRFVAVLVTTERLRLARENLDRYRETVRVSQERRKAGDISPAELDKVSLEQRTFELEVADAQTERTEAVAALLPLLGLDAGDVTVVGDLNPPPARTDVDALVGEALTRRPDLLALERAVEAADARLRLARAERWPDPTVGVQYTHDQFTVSGDLPNSLGTSFSLPLPLFDRNQGQLERAEAEAMIARHELDKTRLAIPQEVRTAVNTYQLASAQTRRYETAYLSQAKEALSGSEASYREGAVSLLEFLEAERAYIQTQRDHLKALLDAYVAAFGVASAAALDSPP